MTLADQMTAELQRTDKRSKIDGDNDLPEPLPSWFTDYLMKRRQVIIMELGEIEDLLRLERSIVPRRKR